MKLFTVEQRKKLLEEGLTRIVEILKRDYGLEKVILFGSLPGGMFTNGVILTCL